MQHLIGTRHNLKKDQKIQQLEKRIDDLEQYTRKDNIFIAGLQTTHLSYARAASLVDEAHGENASSIEGDLLQMQVIGSFNKNILSLPPVTYQLVIRLEN